MSVKFRLIIMSFFQFFIWGSWLITIGAYWFQTLPKIYPLIDPVTNSSEWTGSKFGALFSTMGIASLFMPALLGIIADRFINAEKLYGICHILGAITLFALPMVKDPTTMFVVLLINMCFYMPTLALAITVSYTALKNKNKDIVTHYPPIRVFGTIGFIAALWTVSLLHFETSANQFYVASAASLFLGLYAFTLPKCPPQLALKQNKSVIDALGLTSFFLFKDKKMALFFIFAMLLGAALQLTNAYGDTFIHDFAKVDKYKDLTAVKYPAIIMSISQISETLFILAIPFFLKKFGIKYVMFFSMVAWVLRFGLFAYGNPGDGLWMIILSCIVYGMAFDFFNISGSLFVETQSDPAIRASAQGLFMMMTNGFGAVIGSTVSGLVIQKYFTLSDNSKDWYGIWMAFAGYALVIAVVFLLVFKHKHNPNDITSIHEAPVLAGE